jgi:hypothetical protein
MYPCAITWCIAMTEKTFCPMHEKDQSLHPQEGDEDDVDLDGEEYEPDGDEEDKDDEDAEDD